MLCFRPTTDTYKLLLNETAIKSLPYWGGDGRNHVLVNMARRELSVGSGDAFRGASIGRAMIAQSTFTHEQFRPGFDIVMPPALGPPGGDVWADCAPIAPARRKYLLRYLHVYKLLFIAVTLLLSLVLFYVKLDHYIRECIPT